MNAASAQGQGYVETAKNLASNAAATVQVCPVLASYPPSSSRLQSYLPSTGSGNPDSYTTTQTVTNLVGQAQAGATAAINAASGYASAASEAAQPHINRAKDLATSYLGSGTSEAEDKKTVV